MTDWHEIWHIPYMAHHPTAHQFSGGLAYELYVFYDCTFWWRHDDVTSFWLLRVIDNSILNWFEEKKIKKLALFAKYAHLNVKLPKFHTLINIHEMTSRPHGGNFSIYLSQLRYSPKMASIALVLLLIKPFENWPFKASSRDTRWRHDEKIDDMHNFIIAAMLVQNFIKIVCCLIAKVLHTLSLYKTYGILRQEEEEETRGYLSVCKTDQMAFPALDYLASYRISIKLDCL